MADVRVSRRYDLGRHQMWERIGDPGSLADWHPAIESVDVLDDGKRRVNTVVGGGEIHESILERGESSYSYRIDESPLPFETLVGRVLVTDDTTGCVVEWEAAVEPRGVSAEEAADLVHQFLQAGLDALAGDRVASSGERR